MHTPEDMTPAQRELELALRSLRPDASGVDEVELAFRLGEAAGVRRLRRWQGSAVLSGVAAMVSIGMAISLQAGGRDAPPMTSGAVVADATRSTPDAGADQVVSAPLPAFSMRGLYLTSSYMRQRERSLQLGSGELGGAAPTNEVRTERAAAARRDPGEQSAFELFMQALNAGRKL